MKTLLAVGPLAVVLALSVPLMAQDGAVTGGGTALGGAGIGTGTGDKDPDATPSSGVGGGGCSSAPETPAPNPGSYNVVKDLGPGTFPDVAFHRGKLWVAYRVDREIRLLSGAPDLAGLALVKSFPLLAGAGGFPRLGVACGTLWLAFRDGEPAEAIKLWRMDQDRIDDLGPGWGNHPVTIGSGYVAWQALGGGIMRRALAGGAKTSAGAALPTGVTRVLPNGQVKTWDEERLGVPWGIAPWYAGDLIAAEDFHDNGVHVQLPGKPRMHLFQGSRAFTSKAAADGGGRYAVGVWQPTVRIAAFSAAGAQGGPNASDPLMWTSPAFGATGSGVVTLSGVIKENVKKVEILINLKKVGDALLDTRPVWHYALDTKPYSGGINVSALATLADGTTFRQTIRYNVK